VENEEVFVTDPQVGAVLKTTQQHKNGHLNNSDGPCAVTCASRIFQPLVYGSDV